MDRFEKKIKESFQSYREEPPAELWEAIESKLDEQSRPGFLWMKIAAALLLLVVSMASVVLFLPSVQQGTELAEAREAEPVPHTGATDPSIAQTLEQPPREVATADAASSLSATATADITSRATLAALQPETETLAGDAELFVVSETAEDAPITHLSMLAHNPSFAHFELPGLRETSLDADETFISAILSTAEPVLEIIDSRAGAANMFALTAYFAPQHSYRYQRNNSNFSFGSLEREILSFSAGINISYRFNRRWEVLTGVAYNLMGQAINDIAAFSHPSMTPLYSSKGENINQHPQSLSTSLGSVNFTNQSFYFADLGGARIATLKGSYDDTNINLLNKSGIGLVQHLGFVEVPLALRYKVIDRLFSVWVKSGVSANFLADNNVYLEGSVFNNPVGENVGVRNLNWAGNAGVAVSYPLTARMHLSLEPTVSMFINSVGSERYVASDAYPYNYSLFISIRHDL